MTKIQTFSRLKTNYYSIKKYNDDIYKLTYHKFPVINPGFENDNYEPNISRDVNEQKLDNNISRAKNKIFEYAAANEFDYFLTLTLSKEKYDRYDLSNYIKDLGQFIRNYRGKHNIDIQYLLIPEPHLDGAWHMHGLIKGIPPDHLEIFTLEDKIPKILRGLIAQGHKIYNWSSYSEKFGWCTVEKVKSVEAISKYITKYISKSLRADLKREKEKKLYYVTRGLKTATKVKEGTLTSSQLDRITFDFDNDYVKSKMLNGFEFLELNNNILGGDLKPLII